jgi:peptide chain release factor 1
MDLTQRIEELRERHAEVERLLADPEVSQDRNQLRDLAREHRYLEPILAAAQECENVNRRLEEDREVLRESEDSDLKELARAEIPELESEVKQLADELHRLLVPRDPLDDKDAMIEVRAGTGGEEATLFASELLRMYTRYAERHGWRIELIDISSSDSGGVREAVALVHGDGAFGVLRHESGVHRVQRVPQTESQGRIHTSAATVAVLPEAEEVDVEIDENDLKIDVFRSSGPGGQSVNTTDSAVRITHVPSCVVVQCQDEKSQHKNKAKALKVLRSRLLDRRIAEQQAERAQSRKAQVGTGDRSAKIRTYNFPQGRVTDHRINLTLYKLDGVLDGDLEELIEALVLADQAERISG